MSSNSLRVSILALMVACGAVHAQPVDGAKMVFFDWGKQELSVDAKATLDRLADEFQQSGATRLELQSHSDRSGPASANVRMSRKRAEMVSDYLVSRGVSRSAIRIEAMGEADPLIATQDGVREIQNRRVELKFSN